MANRKKRQKKIEKLIFKAVRDVARGNQSSADLKESIARVEFLKAQLPPTD